LGYTFINISKHEEPAEKSYWKLWLVGILAVLIACFLHWGGFVLVAGDSVPEHVDAAVVLQGSIASENARTAAAMALLERGAANRVAISVLTATPKGARGGRVTKCRTALPSCRAESTSHGQRSTGSVLRRATEHAINVQPGELR
jgi:hypothetical protein